LGGQPRAIGSFWLNSPSRLASKQTCAETSVNPRSSASMVSCPICGSSQSGSSAGCARELPACAKVGAALAESKTDASANPKIRIQAGIKQLLRQFVLNLSTQSEAIGRPRITTHPKCNVRYNMSTAFNPLKLAERSASVNS
jgi:hypothetical protein